MSKIERGKFTNYGTRTGRWNSQTGRLVQQRLDLQPLPMSENAKQFLTQLVNAEKAVRSAFYLDPELVEPRPTRRGFEKIDYAEAERRALLLYWGKCAGCTPKPLWSSKDA